MAIDRSHRFTFWSSFCPLTINVRRGFVREKSARNKIVGSIRLLGRLEGNRGQTYNIEAVELLKARLTRIALLSGKVAVRLPKISSLIGLTSVRVSNPSRQRGRPKEIYCVIVERLQQRDRTRVFHRFPQRLSTRYLRRSCIYVLQETISPGISNVSWNFVRETFSLST